MCESIHDVYVTYLLQTLVAIDVLLKVHNAQQDLLVRKKRLHVGTIITVN